jgi:hypothetical protein
MRKFVLALSLLFTTSFAFAQMGINATGAAPATSAMLDVSSNSKGFLPPRMTTAQRGAIVAPAKGLVVYDTDENELYLYRGTGDNWYKLSSINPPLSLTSSTLTPIIGISTNPNAGNVGVQGETVVNNGGGTGVYGVSRYATPAGDNYGVYGENLSTNNFGYGIYGKHAGTGTAIIGDAPNGGIAIKAIATTGNAIEATSSTGIAVAGSSNTTYTTGLFQVEGLVSLERHLMLALAGECKQQERETA